MTTAIERNAGDDETPAWVVLVIEDNEQMRLDIVEELDGQQIGGREVRIRPIDNFETACAETRERRADLVILDVYKGNPLADGEPAGLDVLARLKESGFVSVVLYTADPEGVRGSSSPFVRVVGKDESGVAGLRAEVEDLFAGRMPQIFRAIVGHLDQTLRDYMWGFVEGNWSSLRAISSKPEFLRLLLNRLAASLSREGVDRITAEAFGLSDAPPSPATHKAHPSDYYVMPPVGPDVLFGDIRIAESGSTTTSYWVVVWPSCDMVTGSGRSVKADSITCASATLLAETSEMTAWLTSTTNAKKRRDLAALLSNKRSGDGVSPDRYHFLPGFLRVPDLVVDFQNIHRLRHDDVKAMECLATLASPFAESLGARYQRYIGRLGVPDLDSDVVLARIITEQVSE